MTHRFTKIDGASLAVTNPDHPDGKVAPFFTGRIITHPERLDIPVKRRKPTVYSIWNDLMHNAVPDSFIGKVFEDMASCQRHTFLILTKRPERMIPFVWPDNVWTGLTVCHQDEADEKIPVFLEVPGKKFLSIEPMLGPIDLDATCGPCHCWRDGSIKAVILGGETGPGARPMHPDWVRSIRDQCSAAGVPFFFKQWGEWVPSYQCETHRFVKPKPYNCYMWDDLSTSWRYGRKFAGRLLDGWTHDELPWRTP